jgi:hypothetical protein
MTEDTLTSAPAIVEWLRTRMRKGEGLSLPYARRWEIAGRVATNFLWEWPADRLSDLGSALDSLGRPVSGTPDGVRVNLINQPVWLGVNRSSSGDGPPDAYLVRFRPEVLPDYVGNSPEVVEELLRGLAQPSPPAAVDGKEVQVGFPGGRAEPTYVGSWQWDIHGEARGEDAIRRAAAATMAAIDKRRSQR